MKILFNCLTMEKGGAERVIAALANNFSKKNNVTILSLTKSKDAYKLNSSIQRLHVDSTSYKDDNSLKRKLRKISLRRIVGLSRIIKTENPDVIISFLPEPSIRLMFIKRISSKIRGIPTIISIRTDPKMEYKNPFIRLIVKRLYRNVDGMVYQTDDAKKYFEGIIKTNHQIIIQNPVDKKSLLKPKNDSEKNNIIIAVGRLEKAKNQELLIRAFYGLSDNVKSNYIVKIYGEGSYRFYLENLIKELGLEEKIFLMGQVDNVAQKLNEAKIYVFSSLYEGMPNSLIEAMAMGLPCIATDCPCGGPRSLIVDEDNGILVKNGDVKALRLAIETLINNKKMREKLASKAVAIRESNDIDKIAKEWILLVKSIMEE